MYLHRGRRGAARVRSPHDERHHHHHVANPKLHRFRHSGDRLVVPPPMAMDAMLLPLPLPLLLLLLLLLL